jgi:hypothetical protein
MLSHLFRLRQGAAPGLITSKLFNENTFYSAFTKDLNNCYSELIIESPFVTNRTLESTFADFTKTKGTKG